jgi:DNA-binding beta-propeller fold protein YncE
VIDGNSDRYLDSILNLPSVAGALVSDDHDLVFTSNRGENTVGIYSPGQEASLVKVPVGVRPNGLAYDPVHGREQLRQGPAVGNFDQVTCVCVVKGQAGG